MTQETDPGNPLVDEGTLPYLKGLQEAVTTIFNMYFFYLNYMYVLAGFMSS